MVKMVISVKGPINIGTHMLMTLITTLIVVMVEVTTKRSSNTKIAGT